MLDWKKDLATIICYESLASCCISSFLRATIYRVILILASLFNFMYLVYNFYNNLTYWAVTIIYLLYYFYNKLSFSVKPLTFFYPIYDFYNKLEKCTWSTDFGLIVEFDLIFFLVVVGVWTPDLYIFYALSISTELSSRGQFDLILR